MSVIFSDRGKKMSVEFGPLRPEEDKLKSVFLFLCVSVYWCVCLSVCLAVSEAFS